MWQNSLYRFLVNNGIAFTENSDMSKITSMRCGGTTRFLVMPTVDNVASLMCFLRTECIKYKIAGGMTNTLPCDGVFDGALLLTSGINHISIAENNRVLVGAGRSLASFVATAVENNIGGFEEISGIPGTVGGAVYGNSGAHSVSISDFIISVRAYDTFTNKTVSFAKNDLDYGYRASRFKQEPTRYVILEATMQGLFRTKDEIGKRVREFSKIRRERQPLNMPSLGSIFKHPEGDFAPRLIESLSLKGLRFGGASVSEKHAGFIVNDLSATSNDVRALICEIKKRVEAEYGIILEEEIDIM